MRPHPRRARTDQTSPRAWATDDKSGFIGNHEDLCYQFEWRGTQLINTRILCYRDQLDVPQRQLGTFVLPPDPVPVMNARPEQYLIDEVPVSTRYTMDGKIRVTVGNLNPSERIVSGDTFAF